MIDRSTQYVSGPIDAAVSSSFMYQFGVSGCKCDYFPETFPRHAKISRASTTILNVIVVLARGILACFGNLPESNCAFYEFMIYRNVK